MSIEKCFLDTETCGFHGMPVLLQYAFDNGEIKLHDIWGERIGTTLALIERIVDSQVYGFNLAFDWFHICKLYTTFKLFGDPDVVPQYFVDELGRFEEFARDGDCLKPISACDLFLHARKGPYQSTMDRHDIRIRRVPTAIAWVVAEELSKRLTLKDIYFARKKDKKQRWVVRDRETAKGNIDPDFKDICLNFAPSSGLKALAADMFGEDDIINYADIEVDPAFRPEEKGWAPFARVTKDNWTKKIEHHIKHWRYNTEARKYAAKDVDYTRRIYQAFGCPEAGDDDSLLSVSVAAVRWKGFAVDIPLMQALRKECLAKSENTVRDPERVKKYIWPHLTESEIAATEGSTSKKILEVIAAGEGIAAERAKEVTSARTAYLEMQMYDKILEAGRLHASFKVTGTLSNRMSGDSDLNPMGIPHENRVRECFPLANKSEKLCGGDFKSFEVVLAAADYNDPKLNAAIKSGKKIHAQFGTMLFEGETYDSIIKSDGTAEDLYTPSKQGVFALIYGGNEHTLATKLNILLDRGKTALEMWYEEYPGIKIAQKRVEEMFTSLKQMGGLGTQITYSKPHEYVESAAGFKRYFTLENQIIKVLYDLANKPPNHWKNIRGRVIRRPLDDGGREQTMAGASRSAIFGAAFAIEGAIKRAAVNHKIQSRGATICKRLQCKIWELQPIGIKPWRVRPMQVHDEVLAAAVPEVADQIPPIVESVLEFYRPDVPLIGIDWKNDMETWASKKG